MLTKFVLAVGQGNSAANEAQKWSNSQDNWAKSRLQDSLGLAV